MSLPWYMWDTVVPFGNPNYDAGLGGAHDMDVGAPPNYPVTLLLPGTISDISAPSWGKQLCVKLDSPVNGVPYMGYLHLSAIKPGLSVGQHISAGQLIGWVGGGNSDSQYLGTTNPTGSNFINSPDMSSRTQVGVALHRGPAYGGAGWEIFPPVDWSLDATPIIEAARKAYIASGPVQKFGRIGLFFGVDTYHWNQSQWASAAQFCQNHRVNFAIIKVFESTQGEWYGGNFTPIMDEFTSRGVAVLPYGFLYGGSDLTWEISMLKKYMTVYGSCAADMEGGWWQGNAGDAQKIAAALGSVSGLFLVSLPANPDVSTFKPLAPVIDMAMPMSYSDYLVQVTQDNMSAIGVKHIGPTLDLSQEFGANNLVANASWARQFEQVSFWYYDFAGSNPGVLDQLIRVVGEFMASLPSGWTDDGTSLKAPNGFRFVQGFRSHVLPLLESGAWDAGDVPLENERGTSQPLEHRPDITGSATAQTTRDHYLWWTPTSGVVDEKELGIELFLKQKKIDDANGQIATLNQKVADLEAQLAAAQGGIPDSLQAVINNSIPAIDTLIQNATALEGQLKPFVK